MFRNQIHIEDKLFQNIWVSVQFTMKNFSAFERLLAMGNVHLKFVDVEKWSIYKFDFYRSVQEEEETIPVWELL